jgi:hypothetical protein
MVPCGVRVLGLGGDGRTDGTASRAHTHPDGTNMEARGVPAPYARSPPPRN